MSPPMGSAGLTMATMEEAKTMKRNRKFYDTESGKIVALEELESAYCADLTEEERNEYGSFARWLEEITGKNGTLEEVR